MVGRQREFAFQPPYFRAAATAAIALDDHVCRTLYANHLHPSWPFRSKRAKFEVSVDRHPEGEMFADFVGHDRIFVGYNAKNSLRPHVPNAKAWRTVTYRHRAMN